MMYRHRAMLAIHVYILFINLCVDVLMCRRILYINSCVDVKYADIYPYA